MIIITLLLCFTTEVSAVPVNSNVRRPLLLQGGETATQGAQHVVAANQKPESPTPASVSPSVQPQAGGLQQPDPQPIPSLQQYPWYPQGGMPMQPLFYGPHQLTLPQQPLIFPPYGYLPLFSSHYGNQLFSPYGYPMILESALPQIPANQLPNSPVLPAENAAGVAVAPSIDATQGIQQPQQQLQQQNPQIVYMLQQPMSSPLGSLSSEELQMAATMGQLGVYMPNVLTNQPAGAVQPESQAAGLTHPEQQGVQPAVGTSAAGAQPIKALPCSGSQPNASGFSAGLAGSDAATAQTPAEPQLQPMRETLV